MGCGPCCRKKDAPAKVPVLVETPYTPDNECPWDAKPSVIFPMNTVRFRLVTPPGALRPPPPLGTRRRMPLPK